MGGKGGGSTTTTTDYPPAVRDLYSESAARALQLQRDLPLQVFMRGGSAPAHTGPRARQFAQAQGRVHDPENTARNALAVATRVPGDFTNLSHLAERRVGVQGRENWAGEHAAATQGVVARTPGEFGQTLDQFNQDINPLIQYASNVPTGANIQQSPSYQAAIQAFESAILPQIQNSAQLAGLGRSTGLQQSLAAGQAQYLLPVIQGELAREERGIERATGVAQFGLGTAAELGVQEALAQERGIGRFGEQSRYATSLQADIGGREAARREAQIAREMEAALQRGLAGERGIERGQTASQFLAGTQQQGIQQLMQLGQVEQDYTQGFYDRQTQDFLRRQALAESALYQPFGQIVPSSFGQRASNSKK